MDEITDKKFSMVAKTFQGLEEVLCAELKQIGATDLKLGKRVVEFTGNKALMYRTNFYLRTAIRILKPIARFKVKNETELYKAIQGIRWDSYFGLNETFAIDGVVNSDFFSHSKYVSLKVKDAIVDQFRNKYNKRPYVDVDDPNLRINIHISKDICTVSFDSSGESLHKRGYRIKTGIAPLNEVLAAGMILISGWDGKSTFIDPMCGSGTLLIEAAMIAYSIPPGIYRKKFGFEGWKDFDTDLLEEIYEENASNSEFKPSILGNDISEIACRMAEDNISNAALNKKININIKPVEDYTPPLVQKGYVVTNPPYGERIKKNDINNFYKILGNNFKKKYKGFDIWLLTSNFDAIKHIGLHPSKKITLFNGHLECKFLKYSIYEGSKKPRI